MMRTDEHRLQDQFRLVRGMNLGTIRLEGKLETESFTSALPTSKAFSSCWAGAAAITGSAGSSGPQTTFQIRNRLAARTQMLRLRYPREPARVAEQRVTTRHRPTWSKPT